MSAVRSTMLSEAFSRPDGNRRWGGVAATVETYRVGVDLAERHDAGLAWSGICSAPSLALGVQERCEGTCVVSRGWRGQVLKLLVESIRPAKIPPTVGLCRTPKGRCGLRLHSPPTPNATSPARLWCSIESSRAGYCFLNSNYGDATTADRLQKSHRNLPRSIKKTSSHATTTKMARNTHRILLIHHPSQRRNHLVRRHILRA